MSTSFVSIDFETANNDRASVCSVGLARFENGQLVETFSRLVKPHPDHGEFLNDPWHVQLHGISEASVEQAASFGEVWVEMRELISDLPVVAHNALSVEAVSLRKLFSLYSIVDQDVSVFCSRDMSRSLLNLQGYGLKFVAAELGIRLEHHHDALSDAVAAGQIVCELMSRHGCVTLDDVFDRSGAGLSRVSAVGVSKFEGKALSRNTKGATAKDVIAEYGVTGGLTGPLVGKEVAISGTLIGMTKADAWRLICECGGTPADDFTNRVSFLVLGSKEFDNYRPGGEFTGKMQKAMARIAKGEPVEIISQQDLLDLFQATF